jgi:hypothetical protein
MFTFINSSTIITCIAIASCYAFTYYYTYFTKGIQWNQKPYLSDIESQTSWRFQQSLVNDQIQRYNRLCYAFWIIIILFITGYCIEYYNECLIIQESIDIALHSKIPFNCGYGSKDWDDLDFVTWARLKLVDNSKQECEEWIRQKNRSPYANPGKVLTRYVSQTITEPLTVTMQAFGIGLRSIMAHHNFVMQTILMMGIILLIVAILYVVLSYKTQSEMYRAMQMPILQYQQSNSIAKSNKSIHYHRSCSESVND